MANFIFISHSTIPQKMLTKILFETSRAGFLNIALMHKVNGKFVAEYTESIDSIHVKSSVGLERSFFPDKLKNSKGFTIHIPVFDQPPYLLTASGHVVNKMIKFVEILEHKMNAVANYHIVQNLTDIKDYLKRRQLHLTLNEMNLRKLFTYEENGYCALVPKPPRTSVTELIFIKPFNRFVWLLLGLTVVACLVTWRLFYNRGTSDSFWLLMFGMFAMFVGQGVEFRRTNRVVLIILLQLIVSMIFVLSNGYQGVITSFMIQPESENRIKTVKELLDSDMRISVADYFADVVKNSKEFQAINSRMDVFNSDLQTAGEIILRTLYENRVLILKCRLVPSFMNWFDTVRKNYYKLPQNIITSFGYLGVGYHNPFIQKFQHLMDLSFEAGLPQAWILFLDQNDYEVTTHSHESANLGLKDLSQVFYLLIIGHVCSIFMFLFEIFFHDFIDKIDLSFYTSKLRNYINELGKLKQKKRVVVRRKKNVLNKKSKRPKPEKPKVCRIIVQPADSVV